MSKEIAAVFLKNDAFIELKDSEVHVNLDINTLPVLTLGGLLSNDADLVSAGLVLEALVRNKEGDHPLYSVLSHFLVGDGNLITLLRNKGYYTDEQTLGIKFVKVNENGMVGLRLVKLPVLRRHLDIPLTSLDLTPDVKLNKIENYPSVKALFGKSDISLDIFSLFVGELVGVDGHPSDFDLPDNILKLISNRLIEDLVVKSILSKVVESLSDVCEWPYPETIRLHGKGENRALRVTYSVPVVDA